MGFMTSAARLILKTVLLLRCSVHTNHLVTLLKGILIKQAWDDPLF